MYKRIKICILFIIMIIILSYENIAFSSTISSDINAINDSKYPGIKSLIQNLQKNHPSWKFQVEYTGLNFNDVITNEYQGHGTSPKNLVPISDNYSGMWICSICGKRAYDTGSWYCASEQAIKYMMDPRNSINESDVFQFMDLSYVGDIGEVIQITDADFKISSSYFLVSPSVDIVKIKNTYNNAVIKSANGTIISSGNVSTGNKITINSSTYTIIKKGDVNKDGQVNIVDVVILLNYITGKKVLDNDAIEAGKIQNSSNVTIVDIVQILNYITGKRAINLVENSNSNIMFLINQMTQNMPYIDDESKQAIVNSASKYQVNPLYIVARLNQEQGAGTSPLATGSGFNGNYVGYYNLFNIRASGNSKAEVYTNGLKYADSCGWNTKAKSIEGGIEFIASQYINKKQNTLYYQKFNVVGTSTLYSHQYMQNIMAAQNEGTKLKSFYKTFDGNLTNTYVFTIPVYENMPKSVCTRPNTGV